MQQVGHVTANFQLDFRGKDMKLKERKACIYVELSPWLKDIAGGLETEVPQRGTGAEPW